ncbi:E3 ubiquitin-protein ligase RGLG2 [Dichanthelium oligosanthes]|uniref:E3 ubiquitin-protein ligase RGLG2 n=1 Tax=Dichanthelium oligosanthes TaxID=888268 RepID=A0A1E5WJT5_9POAL|nr:E3 ubiquitin-protein ligase RGLG2 [Dichanthelium oligosanthes]
MGSWCSKDNPSGGRQPHDYNHNYNQNSSAAEASRGGKNRYAKIGDDYHTLEQVTDALAHAGLESSNLIVGIDFTKSNEWTGRVSNNNRSLHTMGNTPNPYEQAISIIGRTLARFDEDNLIPCFGFGDTTTHDQSVFSFYHDNQPCDGFEEALARYREITPQLNLAGPTSFAPIIETAIGIVDSSGGQYHVLLIIADGQVTRSVETGNGQLSPQERETIDAIVKASDYPLSIVLVGVGDGPWDMMRQFDDNIPSRAFDNFQFVNFTQIMSRPIPTSKKEADFALSALMEIPEQFKAAMSLQLLGKRRGFPNRPVLPPPVSDRPQYSGCSAVKQTQSTSYGAAPKTPSGSQTPSAPRQDSDIGDPQTCPICWNQAKDLAFGCGHQTCLDCSKDLKVCPICQKAISVRLKLY